MKHGVSKYVVCKNTNHPEESKLKRLWFFADSFFLFLKYKTIFIPFFDVSIPYLVRIYMDYSVYLRTLDKPNINDFSSYISLWTTVLHILNYCTSHTELLYFTYRSTVLHGVRLHRKPGQNRLGIKSKQLLVEAGWCNNDVAVVMGKWWIYEEGNHPLMIFLPMCQGLHPKV